MKNIAAKLAIWLIGQKYGSIYTGSDAVAAALHEQRAINHNQHKQIQRLKLRYSLLKLKRCVCS